MQFDLLRTCFLAADALISGRNRKIDDFVNALRDLEKERTALVEDCHKRYMLDIKRLSADTYERLYEKYLKVNRKIIVVRRVTRRKRSNH